ncbi:MAG: hypothetical protein LUC98_08690 [Lachnospiraceae bacterium]|nr:hypothetical protein [Lachnospiraceae bacterium]
MDENSTVKDLLNQVANTRHWVDEINKAYLGIDTTEIIKKLVEKGERDRS